jgi:hypothetical protein
VNARNLKRSPVVLNRPSWPGSSRPSTSFGEDVDARVKPAHDGVYAVQIERDPLINCIDR